MFLMDFNNTHYIVGTNSSESIGFFEDGSVMNTYGDRTSIPSNADSVGVYAYAGDDVIFAESTGKRLDLIDAGSGKDYIHVSNKGKGVQVITGGTGYDQVNLSGRKSAWGNVTFSRKYDWGITIKSPNMNDVIVAYDVDMIFLGDVAYWSTENLQKGNEKPLTRDEITNVERNPDWVYSTSIFRDFDLEKASQEVVKDYFGGSSGGSDNIDESDDLVRHGTNGDDIFIASDKDETVFGYAGDDFYIKPLRDDCACTCFEPVKGNKKLDMAGGNDTALLNLSYANAHGYNVKTKLGSGDDHLEIWGGSNGQLSTNGGSGNDYIRAITSLALNNIKGGKGNDHIKISSTSSTNSTTLSGGKGADTFMVHYYSRSNGFTLLIDDFSIEHGDQLYVRAEEDIFLKFKYKQKGEDLHVIAKGKTSGHKGMKWKCILKNVDKNAFLNSGSMFENKETVGQAAPCPDGF